MNDRAPTARFTNRAQDYAQFRPGYPNAIFGWLGEAGMLKAGQIAADIGAGTGIFTKELLGHFQHVYAVEPNADMRAAAQADLDFL